MSKKKKTIANNNKVSESEFLEVLDNISKRLVHKFKFGYHDIDDMKQQAAIFALEGLEKYDNSRPLENFLWTHVRNRLFNYKRNNYQRPDKPCLNCPLYDPTYRNSTSQCSKYNNKKNCELYAAWSNRNENKKNIMQPSYIDYDIEHKNDLEHLIQKYDNSRPLENFLWTHVRNRLFNYKRNNYQRPDKPCLNCPLYDPTYRNSTSQCSKYNNKKNCELYAAWSNRNENKKNIMQPSYIDYDIEHKNDLEHLIQNNEIITFLDENIHADHRENYLRLKHGEKLNKHKLTKLQKHIKDLMESELWTKRSLKNEDN